MDYRTTKRSPCSICGLETFRHHGWFLVVENRWLDRIKILSWHASLAAQKGIRSVCGKQHLKELVAHWLTQASLRYPPANFSASAGAVDSVPSDSENDLGPDSIGLFVGELAVHRETFSHVWSGSPEALECILDALIAIGSEDKPHALEFRLFDSPEYTHRLSLE